jgi:hypothetical protein
MNMKLTETARAAEVQAEITGLRTHTRILAPTRYLVPIQYTAATWRAVHQSLNQLHTYGVQMLLLLLMCQCHILEMNPITL